MFRIFLFISTMLFVSVIYAEPFWGSKVSQPIDTDSKDLKAGQFIWKDNDNASAYGAVVALVSIPEQRLYLYRHGQLIGISTVSTGKRGYGTPAGIFTVLEKDRHHRSRTYDNAPMPYANRLTWQGVALHAGHVMSYPASHGCIRLPSQFAKLLFNVSSLGMTVVVIGYPNDTVKLSLPTALITQDMQEDKRLNMPDLADNEEFRFQPENALEGNVSIVMSEANQYLLVYRNGIEIGRAKISMKLSDKFLNTWAFVMQQGDSLTVKPILSRHWLAIGEHQQPITLNNEFFEHLDIPFEFAKAVDSILTPDTTLVISNRPVLKQSVKKASQIRCIRGNCLYGQGIEIYADGSKYIGQFKNGLSEGQGQLILPNGKKYVGTFKNDRYQWN